MISELGGAWHGANARHPNLVPQVTHLWSKMDCIKCCWDSDSLRSSTGGKRGMIAGWPRSKRKHLYFEMCVKQNVICLLNNAQHSFAISTVWLWSHILTFFHWTKHCFPWHLPCMVPLCWLVSQISIWKTSLGAIPSSTHRSPWFQPPLKQPKQEYMQPLDWLLETIGCLQVAGHLMRKVSESSGRKLNLENEKNIF